MIVLLAGLPGTGKSTIARGLADQLSAVVLDKDRIRAALFAPNRVAYTTEQDDFCQTIMLQTAEYLLRERPDEIVVLDGRTFSRSYQVQAVQHCAAQLATPIKIIEVICSDETARARLERDAAAGTHLANNRSFALYQAVKARFESIPPPKLVIHTDGDIHEIVARCVEYISLHSSLADEIRA